MRANAQRMKTLQTHASGMVFIYKERRLEGTLFRCSSGLLGHAQLLTYPSVRSEQMVVIRRRLGKYGTRPTQAEMTHAHTGTGTSGERDGSKERDGVRVSESR